MRISLVFAAAVVWCASALVVRADLINEVVAHDMHINPRVSGNVENSNFGAGGSAIVGGTTSGNDFQVPLFRWTLSTVPANHIATSNGTITLNLLAGSLPFINGVDQVAVHYIKPGNAGWIQGDGGAGSPDADGEPTWNNFAHPSTAWVGGPGLGNNAGGGASGYETAFHTFTYDSSQSQVVIPVDISVINDWIANPGNNAGILMRQITMDGTERLQRIHSREGNLALAAVLSFETALVPEPSGVLLASIGVAGIAAVRRRRRRK